MSKLVEERIRRWKTKLIDLSKRNRLLNFRPTKVTTIHVIDEIPPEIFKIVVRENKTMEFLSLAEDYEGEKEDLVNNEINSEKRKVDTNIRAFQQYDKVEEKHTDKFLQTDLPKRQLTKNLFRIHSKAASIMEEQGYNVLFLALGFLEWYESQDSNVKLKAPIILIPVELIRKSVKGHYKLNYIEESPILNPALVKKLLDFNIQLGSIEEDLENINPQQLFVKIQHAIKKFENWRVTNDIYLSLFSFSKFIMYKDIDTHFSTLIDNKIIKTICGELLDEKVSLNLFSDLSELERNLHPLKTFQVLDADSSQQKAILAVKEGSDLLIEGPPGTGKSQTIANIIAECLADGKKVLFVSQKMAALEVVKKRLQENKLGDFCLELHSRKVNKSEVIKELVRILELEKQPDHAHDEELLELEKFRNELNEYVKELHRPYGKLEMTPYQAFGILYSHRDMPDLGFMFQKTEEWDRNKFNNCCDLLDSLVHNLKKVYDPEQNPWKGSKLTNLRYGDKLEYIELVDRIMESYPSFQEQVEKLTQESVFQKVASIKEIELLIGATNLLINSPKSSRSILENNLWNALSADITNVIDTVKFYNEFKMEMNRKYSMDIIDIELQPFIAKYTNYSKNIFFFLNPSFWKTRRVLKKFFLNEYRPKLEALKEDLNKLNKGKRVAEKLNAMMSLGTELFGDLWKGRDTDWKVISSFSNWIVEFRQYVIKNYFRSEIFDKISEDSLDKENLKILASSVLTGLKQLRTCLSTIFEKVKLDELEAFGRKTDEIPLGVIIKKISDMRRTIENLDLWVRYQVSLAACEGVGIGDFLAKIKSDKFPYEKVVQAFKCQFLRCWIDAVFKERPALGRFYGEDHERLIQKFRDIDRKQIELAKIRIKHSLSGKVDSSWEATKESELGILLRESRKSRAHKPVRVLFKQIPNIMKELKPCLMMSPLTVAQFIDPDLLKFDVVIFDEASQILPEDSLGSIMRGKQFVVAGDSKQLPPTTFFQSEVITPEDEEDYAEELPDDLPSILDECAAVKFPKQMLRWHYRSRHESLIAFSNKNFYSGNLNTFPCSEDMCDHLGVKLHDVPNTFYDRGGSGQNLQEARAVARAVFEHFKKYPDLSLGVGTFSIRQKYAIEDAIEEILQGDSSLEAFFSQDRHEHFFVKNLEIIQGDERDVIFISVGYGKDKNGRLSMNFGPINKTGGHRRLNVLVTRARNRVEIFSSIKGDDFDLSKTDSIGVHLLKKYLDFADKGRSVLLQDMDEGVDEFSESPFEEAVFEALQQKDVAVRRQVGCSGYRIDLAIPDVNNPGKYILGIECDGACYHSCSTARDRDRLRQQVLEDLGWKIYRVWSTDWFKHPNRELEKLLMAINMAKEQELKKKLSSPQSFVITYKTSLEKTKPSIKNDSACIKPYRTAPIKSVGYPEDFYLAEDSKIANILEKIVQCEGPIHSDEAARRVVQHWGMNSVKNRIKEKIKNAELYCKRKQKMKMRGEFYWPPNMVRPTVRLRDMIDIELIAPEEIGEAAIIVLKKEYSMPKENLTTQTAKAIGLKRVTDTIYKYISKSINNYIKQGKILEINNRYTFNDEEDITPREEAEAVCTENINDFEMAEFARTDAEVNIEKVLERLEKDSSLGKEQEQPTKEKLNVLEKFDVVIRASIDKKEPITIEYKSPTKGKSVRKIQPYDYDGVYIKAHCFLANDDRTFRIDRVKMIE